MRRDKRLAILLGVVVAGVAGLAALRGHGAVRTARTFFFILTALYLALEVVRWLSKNRRDKPSNDDGDDSQLAEML